MKRISTLALTLLLLLCAVPAVSAQQVVATEEDVILLAGSDFQVSNNDTSRVENLLNVLAMHGLTRADGAFLVGDYTPQKRETNTSSEGIAALKEVFRPVVGDNMIFTQGNHDHVDTVGLAKDGNNDPASGKYGVFVINENQRMEFNYPYTYETTKQAADELKAYLDVKAQSGWTKPIFVLNHIPLHWGNRTIEQGVGAHAELLVKVLNEAGKKGLNIIYLYGHNHGSGYDDFLGNAAVYLKKGDQMEVCVSEPETAQKIKHTTYTLNFTYMNAGYIGYVNSPDASVDCSVTMSVFLIRGDEVIITRYDEEINFVKDKYGIHDLKSPGKWVDKYNKEGYHAAPNTTRYASSRKVTTTDDVAVEAPRYSPLEDEEPEEPATTTTAAPTKTQTTVPITTATIPMDPIGTGTPSIEAPSATTVPVTDPSRTVIEHDCVMPEDGEEDTPTSKPGNKGEETSTTPKKPFPLGLVLGILGGVIVVAFGVTAVLLYKKKNS